MSTPAAALLRLSHELGREDRSLAILGEGNTSVRLSPRTFLVKASGSNLAGLERAGLTECRFTGLLPLLERARMTDGAVDDALYASRVSRAARKPSVEAVFHAWLLTLPGVAFVGHTHPVAVNALLCSRWGRVWAGRRIFPDEVVCCGEASVYVPYADPGLKLAQAIRRETAAFLRRRGQAPRVILIENHGLIALGATPEAVLAATLMADKAARIIAAAAAASAPRFLPPAQIARIAGRADELHRQRVLGIEPRGARTSA
jgi:rhamnose utilization protein RhaD (predicted bifunctional aldolase and dehydrogenase)